VVLAGAAHNERKMQADRKIEYLKLGLYWVLFCGRFTCNEQKNVFLGMIPICVWSE
jgi:hypothetical protein